MRLVLELRTIVTFFFFSWFFIHLSYIHSSLRPFFHLFDIKSFFYLLIHFLFLFLFSLRSVTIILVIGMCSNLCLCPYSYPVIQALSKYFNLNHKLSPSGGRQLSASTKSLANKQPRLGHVDRRSTQTGQWQQHCTSDIPPAEIVCQCATSARMSPDAGVLPASMHVQHVCM